MLALSSYSHSENVHAEYLCCTGSLDCLSALKTMVEIGVTVLLAPMAGGSTPAVVAEQACWVVVMEMLESDKSIGVGSAAD